MTLLPNQQKKQGQDIAELTEFAEDELGLDTMERWDLEYCRQKLMEKKYQISSEILKPYFPMKTVLRGLFTLINRLYGVEFKANRVDTWNKDVTYYDVLCDGERVAGVFLDPYARSDKQGGAWMNDAITRFRTDTGDLQLPVAYICCNFTPPNDSTPSLLTHRDVETLFHEFGHGLHHMLTQIETLDVSGISGVEWDAVELPSQFMENWCWDRESLNMFSGHYVTGEKLPDDLFDNLVASKHFMSGYMSIRQMEMSLFDFRLHMEYEDENIFDILDSTREEVGILPAAEFDRLPNSFSHIFGGGYAAGYYSYKWAEVLSADAFSLFEENGIFDKATGDSFKKEILEMGGSRKAMDSFVAFRGRKPSPDALLRHTGIIK